jgi:hypothetical protein
VMNAREAHDLSTAARERLSRAELEHMLAKVEAEVMAATARGDYSCSLPYEAVNSEAVHQTLTAMGYALDTTGGARTRRELRLHISWGAAKRGKP